MNRRQMLLLNKPMTYEHTIRREFLSLQGVIGLWIMKKSNPLYEETSGKALTQSGTPAFTKTNAGGLYADKIITDYWSFTDQPWNSPTGEIFIAGYVQHDGNATAQETYLSKYNSTDNNRCYVFRRQATGQISIACSADGSTVLGVDSGAGVTLGTTWAFVAGRFIPSTSFSVWLNNTRVDAATICAGIKDGSNIFELGSWFGGSAGMVGNMGVFGFYNKAPSNQQVLNLYNNTKRFYPN